MDDFDDVELLAELDSLAHRQKQLRAELEQVVSRRTELVAEARARKLATWRVLALKFEMTEHGLIKASVSTPSSRRS